MKVVGGCFYAEVKNSVKSKHSRTHKIGADNLFCEFFSTQNKKQQKISLKRRKLEPHPNFTLPKKTFANSATQKNY